MMTINIKKRLLTVAILLAVFAFQGCGGRDKKLETSQTEEGKPKDVEHNDDHGNEAEALVATLTPEQIKEVGITLGHIEYKQLDAVITANGQLRVPNDSKGDATSLYGGVIKSLNVQVGDFVSKGQVVASIANPQFVQLQEEYLTIDSRILLAEQEQNRQQELNAGNAGARKNLQSAIAELNTLRTRKASLRQQLEMMGINPTSVSNTSLRATLPVRSPINGAVSNVFGKIGAYVDTATPIIEVINNNSLHLDLQVFEKDLPKMKVGQTVHFNLTNNPTMEYDAKIFSVGSSFENDSKTIAVHAKVLGNRRGLIDGMNITGMVSLDNVTTAAVPNDAIVEAEGKYFIFIKADEKFNGYKKEEEGQHENGSEKSHGQKYDSKAATHNQQQTKAMSFEKFEVVKGISSLGYTGITFIKEVPKGARVVIKGAFFINAKLSNTGEHDH